MEIVALVITNMEPVVSFAIKAITAKIESVIPVERGPISSWPVRVPVESALLVSTSLIREGPVA